ncbi:TrmH family RNA methyltransferase [Roseomonas elaeocarpi]|uniref:TrmH family RNA methyltransferase n=1 Tax=Roseomonas elaeocarpi TaxID=907779 RepID=A0ABV6JV97_9PROT
MRRAPPAGLRPPRPPEPDRICGRAAVHALFARRPGDILRLFYMPELRGEAGAICGRLAQLRRPYREVGAEELSRIAGTAHHGGIVAVAIPRRVPILPVPLPPALLRAPVLPVLDGVGNPHNLGAIARSAAFFGCIGLVVSDDPRSAGLSEAAFRTAEGGLEALSLYGAPDLPAALWQMSKQVLTVAAVANDGVPPEALPHDRPIALVLGNEERGLGQATAGACAARVTLPGSGRVQSLNVSVAAAVLIHALSSH